MTPEKKAARTAKNRAAKAKKAADRKSNLALVGRLVYEKTSPVETVETDNYGEPVFSVDTVTTLHLPPAIRTARDGSILPLKIREPKSVPALAFIGAKSYRHSGPQSKTRPANKELHAEAVVELHSRSHAVAMDANPTPEASL